MLYIQYAEEFGCHPHEVRHTVPIRWWHRWLLARKTSASAQAWQQYNQNGSKGEDKDVRELRYWAMFKDRY